MVYTVVGVRYVVDVRRNALLQLYQPFFDGLLVVIHQMGMLGVFRHQLAECAVVGPVLHAVGVGAGHAVGHAMKSLVASWTLHTRW